MSILTDQQIRVIKDDILRRSFVLHNNLNDNMIHQSLQKGLELISETYKDRIVELYDIYVNAEKRKWNICNVNGLKTLMIQKGITKIKCFGCDRELQFNELGCAILIRIYRQTDAFYICCDLCTPNCPTIDMTALDAQRFYLGKRGNVQIAMSEKLAIDNIINDINNKIRNSTESLEMLKLTANALDNDILLHEQINQDKIEQLEKIANREKVLENEVQKQATILKSINETEAQTVALKNQYEALYEKQFEMVGEMEDMSNSINKMKHDTDLILGQFEIDIQVKHEQALESLTSNLNKRAKEIKDKMENIDSISESIAEKLSYDFKCGVCMGRKNPVWAYDCGHTTCKTCIDRLDNKCPTCSAESVHKRQIYL